MIITHPSTENKFAIENISSKDFKEFLAENNVQWHGNVVNQYHVITSYPTIQPIIDDEECSLSLIYKDVDGLFRVIITDKALIFRSEGYFKPKDERIVIDLSKQWRKFINSLSNDNVEENTL